MNITVSIVTFHTSLVEIERLLKSVLASPVCRVYIIDNSSNDSLRELVSISDKIVYIHSLNLGYGAGHNIAIRKAIEASMQYHIVINPDIYFNPEIIERLVTFMDTHKEVGQIMPKVYYPNGDLQYLCKLIPTPFDLIFKRFLPPSVTQKRMQKFQLRFTGYDRTMNVPYLSGCFMFFRVSALQEVGLFDESFFMYPEDIDITRRMHERYETIFYPEVSIIHAHAAASKTNSKMLRIHMLNMIKYFNKWGWFFDSSRKKINEKCLRNLRDNLS